MGKKDSTAPLTSPTRNKAGYCAHYLKTKRRFCKFPTFTEGDLFCAFHSEADTRIQCPLDPNHTVFRHELASHLNKCTSRPPRVLPSWYSVDCNMGLPCDASTTSEDKVDETRSIDLRDLDRQVVFDVMRIAREMTKRLCVREEIAGHDVMDERIESMTQSKHAQQQSSLIGLLARYQFLDRTDLFIEWGAGRAEFSRYIGRTYLPSPHGSGTPRPPDPPHFLLIDRDGGRLKHDRRMIEDYKPLGVDMGNRIRRQKVDIAHVNLDALVRQDFPTLRDPKVCSVSKHLCGAATDLTINCLTRSSRVPHIGVLVALCCHHRCSWRALNPVSRDFLAHRGITSATFRILKDLGAWWTSGLREGMDSESSGSHWTGLTHCERETIGWQCKRAIDLSRIAALEAAGYHAELVKYIGHHITRECVVLLARPQSVIEPHDDDTSPKE